MIQSVGQRIWNLLSGMHLGPLQFVAHDGGQMPEHDIPAGLRWKSQENLTALPLGNTEIFLRNLMVFSRAI